MCTSLRCNRPLTKIRGERTLRPEPVQPGYGLKNLAPVWPDSAVAVVPRSPKRGQRLTMTATPHGPSPTGIVLTTFIVVVSTTDTSFEGPFAENNSAPSGLNAVPHGRSPTAAVPRAAAARRDEDPASVARHGDAHRPRWVTGHVNRCDHFVRRRVDDRQRGAVLRADVRSAAVGRKGYGTWTRPDLDLLNHFVGGHVDDRHLAVLLGRHVDETSVRTRGDALRLIANLA